MPTRDIEILAPAGNRDALIAAVRCGADAVYLGGKDFSARQNAGNFDEDELCEAVSYCHVRGVKVYLTLNTLLTDRQFPQLTQAAHTAATARVDGIIVQDLGVLSHLKTILPDMPLHASTQMAVHSPQGAWLAHELGCSRVVLARECSGQEIESITKQVPIQTEVFVHGALCMGMSGQCYLSAMIGRRSANRGMCAGSCRLPFEGGGKGYALSLKDLSLTDKLSEMCAMGVSSLKIEGRMKRPEYVAAAVTACRDALEGKTVDTGRLAAVFSRSGFTDGYYTGGEDAQRFGFRQKEDVVAAEGVLGELAQLYRNETPLITVDMNLTMMPDSPVTLELCDREGHSVSVRGDTPQMAKTRPTDQEQASKSLCKTGGTPYMVGKITCDIAQGIMLPVSALNRLRSEGLDKLGRARAEAYPRPIFCDTLPTVQNKRKKTAFAPTLRARLETVEQLSEELCERVELFSLPLHLLKKGDICQEYIHKLSVEIPPVLFEGEENRAVETLSRLREIGVSHAGVGNVGGLRIARDLGFTLHGDYTLNITNTATLCELEKLGLDDATLSIELGIAQATDIGGQPGRGLVCYGSLPLMYTRSCPLKGKKGCGQCNGSGKLVDRLGSVFPLLCTDRRHVRILNSRPLYTAHKLDEFKGLDFLSLYFTHESPQKCVEIVRAYGQGGQPSGEHTSGLYFRDKL